MLAEKFGKFSDFGPVALRIALGAIMLFHGSQKLLGLFGGGGLAGTTTFFANVGIPAASLMAILVAVVEFVGGAFLLVGLLTRFTALLLALQFVVIVAMKLLPTKLKAPFSGLEFDLLILAATFALLVMGSAKLSLEHILFKKELL